MKDDLGRLGDIQEAIEKIQQRTSEGLRAFEAEELLQVWVVHHLQIIGEAASKLSAELKEAHVDAKTGAVVKTEVEK